MRRHRATLLIFYFMGMLFPMGVAPHLQAEEDPADALTARIYKLTPEEEKACRELFQKLGDPDFDTRNNALNRLLARGPAVLKLAEEYSKSTDPELAAVTQDMPGVFALKYDGYLPADAQLLNRLNEKLKDAPPISTTIENIADSWGPRRKELLEFARTINLPLYIDSEVSPAPLGPGVDFTADRTRLDDYFSLSARLYGLEFIPRGHAFVITSGAKAITLNTQRYTFDWKILKLDHDEADRVADTLKLFFQPGTELHASSEVLAVRGAPECFPRLARLIALMMPDAPAAIWPKPGNPGPDGANAELKLNTARIAEHLMRPVSILLNNDEPLGVIEELRRQKAEIALWADGREYERRPYPSQLRGLAPLSLKLKDVPLGLALRWLARRAAFAGSDQKGQVLQAILNDEGHILLLVAAPDSQRADKRVAGSDVSFLLGPNDAGLSWADKDKKILQALETSLRPELELFPDFDWPGDLCVLRGRLIMQGHAPALLRILDLLSAWKNSGQVPACAWRSALDEKLNHEVDWNGQEHGAETLLPRLRQLGGLSLLIEPGPDGSLPEFDLSKRQAELLWPGKYPFKALLDDLAKKAHAKWEVKWGAVILMPISPVK